MSTHHHLKRPPARTAGLVPPGAPAPAFDLPYGTHCRVRREDLRGHPAVLVFYVADWHPVCTAQLRQYQDLSAELGRFGAALVAIAPDTVWSHQAFAHALGLTFPLLADHLPGGQVARAYGACERRSGHKLRALFVLDDAGIVQWSVRVPEAVNPGADGILSALERVLARASPRSPPGL